MGWPDRYACLTEEQMQAAIERNRVERAPGACHSHDFCDANLTLDAVFMRRGRDLYGALWAQARNLAKRRDFRVAG
jgi:hypothetical protein